MKRVLLIVLICTILLGNIIIESSADSFERVVCTPLPSDITASQAYDIAKNALYERLDIPDGLLELEPPQSCFVINTGWFGHVDDEPLWEIKIREYTAIISRHGEIIGINGGSRDIPWESDTLAESVSVDPVEGDGTAEEAVAIAWQVTSSMQTPWGEDKSGITAKAELICNPFFCNGSEPVWLVTFSTDKPLYKVLLRWDMTIISSVAWGKEFPYEGIPKWVEQTRTYFPHGIQGFGRWTQEEQAAFSSKYIPIVEEMLQENPHFDDYLNGMYWLTRHIYGVPSDNMISLDAAKEIAKKACIELGAHDKTFDSRSIEAALDITDSNNPIWRMIIGYDYSSQLTDSNQYYIIIHAITGNILQQGEKTSGFLIAKEIW